MRRTTNWLIILFISPFILMICMLMGSSGIIFPGFTDESAKTIWSIRLHRVVAGFVTGAALSTAGCVFQALLRISLAEPYILGVSSGAALGATICIATGISSLSWLMLPLWAFVFALGTLVAVYFLSRISLTISMYNLILSGVVVGAICSSIVMFIVSFVPREGLHTIMWWMLGDLDVYSWELLIITGAISAGGCIWMWIMARDLNAISVNMEIAHTVGVNTKRVLLTGLAVATLVTSSVVSMVGLIGFVGLIVPHMMRGIVGPDHRRLIPACAIGGGIFLAVCDAVARSVLAPREIPVGVITALAGGPFFLMLLRKRSKRQWVD
jgi:iron complex transport system permease protein